MAFSMCIDRTNGKLISATAYGKQTWSDTKDAEGRPVAKKEAAPTLEGHTVCPGALGTTNFMAPTYDPQTRIVLRDGPRSVRHLQHGSAALSGWPCFLRQRVFPVGGSASLPRISEGDRPDDGETKQKFQHTSPTWSGVLSTAGGLVFSGDAEGNFIAFDAASLKPLWHFQMGGAVYARADCICRGW